MQDLQNPPTVWEPPTCREERVESREEVRQEAREQQGGVRAGQSGKGRGEIREGGVESQNSSNQYDSNDTGKVDGEPQCELKSEPK